MCSGTEGSRGGTGGVCGLSSSGFSKAWKADFANQSSKDKAADVPCFKSTFKSGFAFKSGFSFKSGKGRIARAFKSGFAS